MSGPLLDTPGGTTWHGKYYMPVQTPIPQSNTYRILHSVTLILTPFPSQNAAASHSDSEDRGPHMHAADVTLSLSRERWPCRGKPSPSPDASHPKRLRRSSFLCSSSVARQLLPICPQHRRCAWVLDAGRKHIDATDTSASTATDASTSAAEGEHN